MGWVEFLSGRYNVHDFYKNYGMSQRLGKSVYFDNLTMFIIVFNAVPWLYDDFSIRSRIVTTLWNLSC